MNSNSRKFPETFRYALRLISGELIYSEEWAMNIQKNLLMADIEEVPRNSGSGLLSDEITVFKVGVAPEFMEQRCYNMNVTKILESLEEAEFLRIVNRKEEGGLLTFHLQAITDSSPDNSNMEPKKVIFKDEIDQTSGMLFSIDVI